MIKQVVIESCTVHNVQTYKLCPNIEQLPRKKLSAESVLIVLFLLYNHACV
jgi:hypothetical protein